MTIYIADLATVHSYLPNILQFIIGCALIRSDIKVIVLQYTSDLNSLRYAAFPETDFMSLRTLNFII